jgi:hypothetical protein
VKSRQKNPPKFNHLQPKEYLPLDAKNCKKNVLSKVKNKKGKKNEFPAS